MTPDLTLAEAMTLGLLSPIMEPQACSDWGPWHCAPELPVIVETIEWPKGPTPEEIIYGALPAEPTAFTYYGPGRGSAPAYHSSGGPVWIAAGGSHRSGDDRSDNRVWHFDGDRIVTINKDCGCGPKEPPAPIPLPGALAGMLGALAAMGGLWRRR